MPYSWSLTETDIIHGKSIRTCKQINQPESLVKPGSRPDHDGTAAGTRERPLVVDGLIESSARAVGRFPRRPYIAANVLGGFWLGHLAIRSKHIEN